MGTGNILLGGQPCDGLASRLGGRLASCYGIRKLWVFGSCAPLPYLTLLRIAQMSEVLSFCDRERITVPPLFSEEPEVKSTMKLFGVSIFRPRSRPRFRT